MRAIRKSFGSARHARGISIIRRYVPITVILVILGATCYYRSQHHLWPCTQLHLEQAHSLLNGRLDLEKPDIDAVWEGAVIHSPYSTTPVLMYLPWVALFGTHEAIPYGVLLLLSLLCMYFVRVLCAHLKLDKYYYWFLVALIFGTGYWSCLVFSYSAPYNNAIIVVVFLIGALAECLGKCRGGLLGFLWSVAVTTRGPAVFSLLPIVFLVFQKHRGRKRVRQGVWFCLGALPLFLFYMTINYLRFGNPLETGYGLSNHNYSGQLMSLRFVIPNLYFMVLKGFNLTGWPKMLHYTPLELGIDVNGASLLAASPFLVLSFFAPWKEGRVKILWLGIVLSALTVASYCTWGALQVNSYRYGFDFLPLMWLLMGWGLCRHAQTGLASLWKGLVCYSACLNVLAFFAQTPLLNRFLGILLR